jgi:CheY-like chemotaxis protein
MARILIAEDNPGFREWLSEVLTAAGHSVSSAKDGLEAQYLARRGPFDLALTDISMPNEEGLGLIRVLRKSQPELKIIVISASIPRRSMTPGSWVRPGRCESLFPLGTSFNASKYWSRPRQPLNIPSDLQFPCSPHAWVVLSW